MGPTTLRAVRRAPPWRGARTHPFGSRAGAERRKKNFPDRQTDVRAPSCPSRDLTSRRWVASPRSSVPARPKSGAFTVFAPPRRHTSPPPRPGGTPPGSWRRCGAAARSDTCAPDRDPIVAAHGRALPGSHWCWPQGSTGRGPVPTAAHARPLTTVSRCSSCRPSCRRTSPTAVADPAVVVCRCRPRRAHRRGGCRRCRTPPTSRSAAESGERVPASSGAVRRATRR